MKIAFVIQRYGMEINGGAELHCRYVAEHMAKYGQVEVLTSCAKDYITWKNEYKPGKELINGLPVFRFPVQKERDPNSFGRLQERLLQFPHTEQDELQWLEEEGPNLPGLIRYLKENQGAYDFFVFFSYRYYHSFHGIRAVPEKSVLVPTAEPDAVIHFPIFRDLFQAPRAIVYNSVEERRQIHSLTGNYDVPGDVVGVGSEIPARADGEKFRRKYNIDFPFLLYIGRIDENKGCGQMFEFFRRFATETDSNLKLLLIGSAVMNIPKDPRIVSLGFMSDEDKFNALDASELLIMPSFFESLSMVLLEAWGMGKPTLANGNCRVLLGQSIRSNAGLFYTDYSEFCKCLLYLKEHPEVRTVLGENGKRFYHENYRWEVVEQKYLNLLSKIKN
jgi:glycosyltransferase involved in cell wall biosynthesis